MSSPLARTSNAAAATVPDNKIILLTEETGIQEEANRLQQVLEDVRCKHENLAVKCQEAQERHEAADKHKVKEDKQVAEKVCKEWEQVAMNSLQKVWLRLGVSNVAPLIFGNN